MMLDAQLETRIEDVVRAELSSIQVLSVKLEEGQDYDANNVIFVTVNLPSGTGPLPASEYLRAMSAVSQTLLGSSDERTPLFRTYREGEPDVIEDETDLT